jgi:glycerol-3-phosphate O-acyltransferase
VQRRDLPRVGELELDDEAAVRRALDALVDSGVISRFDGGPEPVYRIGPDQQLAAAYYRNTIIHFFVNPAIAELSLLRAAEEGVADPQAEFWDAAMKLRDLLKFEFFFEEKDVFRAELRREIAFQDGAWAQHVAGGGESIRALVRRFKPFSAHRVLRPFLEGYRLVGDTLERRADDAPWDEEAFMSECLGLGKQYHLQRRIRTTDSVSKVLIQNGVRLAGNRDLLEPGTPKLGQRRRGFAEELRAVIRRIDAVDVLAASRRAGLID